MRDEPEGAGSMKEEERLMAQVEMLKEGLKVAKEEGRKSSRHHEKLASRREIDRLEALLLEVQVEAASPQEAGGGSDHAKGSQNDPEEGRPPEREARTDARTARRL